MMNDDTMEYTPRAIAETTTVNEAIRAFPATVAVFNAFAIDACCGGAVPIAEAAARDGADLGALMRALTDAVRGER